MKQAYNRSKMKRTDYRDDSNDYVDSFDRFAYNFVKNDDIYSAADYMSKQFEKTIRGQ